MDSLQMNDDGLDEFLDEINSPTLDTDNSDLSTNLLDASDGEDRSMLSASLLTLWTANGNGNIFSLELAVLSEVFRTHRIAEW